MFRALIVEDQEETAALFAQLLESMGWTAMCVHTGTELLEGLDSGRLALDSFAIAFIDVNLPDLSGIELVRLLRQRTAPAGWQPRFVGTSGYRESELGPLDSQALFDAYLQKPIDFDALEALLTAAQAPRPTAPGPAESPAPRALVDTQALRHRLMGRVWGRVEHDLAGGLSAARLQLTVATRTLARSMAEPPPPALLDSLKQVETFMKQSSAALRRTSWWHVHPQESVDVAQVLQHVSGLAKDVMRPDHFTVALALPDKPPLVVAGRHDACYVLLAALLHFRDAQPAPFVLHVSCLSAAPLALHFVQERTGTAGPHSASEAFSSTPHRPCDASELAALWQEAGWQEQWSSEARGPTLTLTLDLDATPAD